MLRAEHTIDTVTTGLLSDVKEGDSEAWALLVEIYSPVIFVWCRQRGLSPHQAQDVGQEVWTSVWQGLGAFRKHAVAHSFRRWLATIVRNKINDLYRKTKEKELIAPESIGTLGQVENDCENEDVKVIFTKIVEWIASKYREHNCRAFILCYADGLEREEVAKTLGLTRNQVDLACSRILRGLKVEFGDKTIGNE